MGQQPHSEADGYGARCACPYPTGNAPTYRASPRPQNPWAGPAGGYPPAGPPPLPMPPTIMVLPPADPEMLAARSRASTRGLGLGGLIIGVLSLICQAGPMILILLFILNEADPWRNGYAGAALTILFMWVLLLMPLVVPVACLTSIGLTLAALVKVDGGNSAGQPPVWARAKQVMGGALVVSILQCAPVAFGVLAGAFYGVNTGRPFSSGSADPIVLVVAIVLGVLLLVAHGLLIGHIRALGAPPPAASASLGPT